MNPVLTNPFKGLEPFGPGDTLFGRDADLTLVTDRIFRSKTTLLFAGSGVGKTSFFCAKFIPEVQERYADQLQVCYHNKWSGDDPLKALKDTLHAQAGESLLSFFKTTVQTAESSWILILDQFEELFTHHAYRQNFDQFRDELCEAINKTDASVRFAFSMREEFLGELSVFDNRVPDLFGNYYRLKNPDKIQAEQIIRLTAGHAGAFVDQAGLTALIGDLSKVEVGAGRSRSGDEIQRDYVVPPHLQLVCRGLWEMESQQNSEERFLFLAGYAAQERMGTQNPARRILQRFCMDQMEALTAEQQALAAEAFDFLVTSQGAKMSYELKSLAKHMATDESGLAAILERLSNPKTRILRESQWRDERWFELYHDMYAPIVYEWKLGFELAQQKERELEQRASSYDRRAIQAEARGNPDRALMFWLMAIKVRNSKNRRLQAGRLASGATALERTFWHEGPVTATGFGTACLRIVTASTARRLPPTAKTDGSASGGADAETAAEELSLIQVWDVQSGNPVGKPIEVNGVVQAVALSPDDHLVATAGDGGLCVIDTGKGRVEHDWKLPVKWRANPGRSRPRTLRFDDSGERILIEFQTPSWRWLSVDIEGAGKSLKKPRMQRTYMRLESSSDAGVVAALAGDRVAIIDGWTGKTIGPSIPVKACSALALSANGEQLLVGSKHGSVQVWSTLTAKKLGKQILQSGAIRRLAFGAADTFWVESHEQVPGGRAKLHVQEWNTSGQAAGVSWTITGRRVGTRFMPRFSPGIRHLWESSRGQVWRLSSGQPMETVWSREPRIRITWSRDDVYLLTASRVGLARLWKSDDLRPALPMFSESPESSLAVLSRDGSRIAAVVQETGVSVWDAQGGFIATITEDRAIDAIALGPDGQFLATLNASGRVRVWDLATNKNIAEARVRDANTVVFSPDGRFILILGPFGAKWWEFNPRENKRPKRVLGGDSACFSSDRSVFATYGSFGEELFVWDAILAKRLATFRHPGGIRAAVLSADGTLALSAGDDGWAKIWNIKDLEPLQDLPHQGPVTAAAFSRNGLYVATLSDDLFARVWEIRDGNEIGRFRYERSAESVNFSPDDSAVVIAASRAVHICKIDSGQGLLPIATRQLVGSWRGEFSFLDPSANRMLALTQTAFQSWRAEVIRFDAVEGQPIQGEIDSLQESWHNRTGLRYEGEDVVPVTVVRASRAPSQRRRRESS